MESTAHSEELVAQLVSIFETMPPTQIEDLIRSYEGTHTLDFYVDKILEKTITEATLAAEQQPSAPSSQPLQSTDELVSTFEILTPEQQNNIQLPTIQEVECAPIPTPITEEVVEEEEEGEMSLRDALKRIRKLEKELKKNQKEKKKALNWAVNQVETMKVIIAQKDKEIEEKEQTIQQQQERIQTLIDDRATVENNVFNILKATAEKIKDGGNALARGVDLQFEKMDKELPSGSTILATIKSLLSDIAEGSKKIGSVANDKFVQLKEEFDVTKAAMQSYIEELQSKLQEYQQQESTPEMNMNNVEASTQVEQPPASDKSSQTSTSL